MSASFCIWEISLRTKIYFLNYLINIDDNSCQIYFFKLILFAREIIVEDVDDKHINGEKEGCERGNDQLQFLLSHTQNSTRTLSCIWFWISSGTVNFKFCEIEKLTAEYSRGWFDAHHAHTFEISSKVPFEYIFEEFDGILD